MSLRTLVLALLLLPTPALAQGLAGAYSVQGNESARGDYAGHVALTWTGSDYHLVREVEYTTWSYQGRPVSTVWEGSARAAPAGVGVTLSLDRMGWALAGAGLRRTAADGVPMAVAGSFQFVGTDLVGTFGGQGAPFVPRSERWNKIAVAPSAWRNERQIVATHSPPPAWLKTLLFALFGSHHQNAWIAPYAGRAKFQAAMHYVIQDRTDFALHQRRPDLLRVIGRVLDDLACEEALVKANAFGKTLRQKADEAERDIPRFLDAESLVGRDSNGGPVADGDGAEWTGDYVFAEALRYRETGAPEALARVERLVAGLVAHVDITGQPGEFARTLRTAQPGRPPTAPWRAGQGTFAGIEWMEGGNNDMIKGPVMGGVASLEALPAGHPLRAEVARSLDQLAQNSAVVQDGKFNEEMVNGVVSAIRGPGRARDRYLKIARNPFLQLYTVALGAGFYIQGISDWSGSQLSLTGLIARTKIADAHGRRISGLILRLGIRRSAAMQRPVRRAVHSLAAAGLADLPWPWAPFDATDGVWVLREMPYPRTDLSNQQALRADWCASPYPALPWKFDWTTDPGRAQGMLAPPLFETHLSNFYWKNNIFAGGGGGGPVSWSGADYLTTYWLARAYGVIGPND